MREVLEIDCGCHVPWWVFAASIWLGMVLGKADNRYGGPVGDWLATKVKEVWRFFWATFHTK